jgi:putative heme-binding domain-containing protein
LLRTLARLYNREDDWNGRWWGTRPDTTGPYFKPVKWSESDRIAGVLRDALAQASADTLGSLVVELQRNRVDLPELNPLVLKLASESTAFKAVAVELFSGRAAIPDEAIGFFGSVAASDKEDPALRAKAIRALQRNATKPEALYAAVAALTSDDKLPDDVNNAWQEFVREPRHTRNISYFTKLAETDSPEKRTLAYGVLANLPNQRFSSGEAKETAARAVEQAWLKPASSVPLLRAIARLRLNGYELQVRGLATDKHADVARAAKEAAEALGLNKSSGPTDQPLIEAMKFEDAVAFAAKEKGDERRGALLFIKQGCVACHTVSSDEAPKGPFLGGIATRFSRAELCESILKPGAKIAQGFETQWFKMKGDEEVEGFVTREGGDDLDLRNIAGVTTTLTKKDIAERGKRDTSMMPTGLVDKLPPEDLAALLAYLESLSSN